MDFGRGDSVQVKVEPAEAYGEVMPELIEIVQLYFCHNPHALQVI